jgi:hypothetical protein
VPDIRVGDEMLKQLEAGGVQPLQVIEEEGRAGAPFLAKMLRKARSTAWNRFCAP